MKKKTYVTPNGAIVYWTNEWSEGQKTLIFLPGLTADHRRFDKQIEYFQDKYNVLVWDAPGHAASRPFQLTFSMKDKAKWLYEIMECENTQHPIIVGQSMGGYVAQVFMEAYPEKLEGFVSVDSCPLQRRYMTAVEIWLLKHTEPIYRLYPWKSLQKTGANGCAETDYGRRLMWEMMEVYTQDTKYYCKLVSHRYRIVAEAVEADLPYEITCPALLLCGEFDKAGSAKRYMKRWTKESGIRLEWIKGAGHNSNTDQPDVVNELLEKFVEGIGN